MNTKNNIVSIMLLTLIFFAITFLVIYKNNFVINIDVSVKTAMESWQSPSITQTMLSLTKIVNVLEASLIFIIFGLFLILKNKKYFYIFALATTFGVLLPWVIKLLVERERPSLLLEQDYSFPSAHATIAIVFLLSSIYFVAPLIKNALSKNIFVGIISIIFPLVAFSRIYLSAHWVTDVIAGIILGAICFISAKYICCHEKKNVL